MSLNRKTADGYETLLLTHVGEQGPVGPKGSKGDMGNTWYAGTDLELNSPNLVNTNDMKIGDYYLNTNSGNVLQIIGVHESDRGGNSYEYSVDLKGNIHGRDGSKIYTVTTLSEISSLTDVREGDVLVTTDTFNYYTAISYTDRDGTQSYTWSKNGCLKPNVVQISREEPTDPDVKIWIDPSEIATEDMTSTADQLRAEIQALKNAFPSLQKDDSFYVMTGNYGSPLFIDSSYYMMTKPIPAKTTSIDVTWHVEHNVPGTGRISIISDKTNKVLASYEYSFETAKDYTFSIPMGFGEETVLAVASDCVGYSQSSEDGVRTEVQPGGGLPTIATDGTKLLPVGSVITRGSMDGHFYFGVGVTTYVAEGVQGGTMGGEFTKTGLDYRPDTRVLSTDKVQVGTIGRWYKDASGNLKTGSDGAEFYFKTIGASACTISFNNSTTVNIAYSIDGAAFTYRAAGSSVSLTLDSSTPIHIIRVIIDGMAEYCGKTTGGGCTLTGVTATGGTVYPIIPNCKVIAFYGDSITEGTNTLGPDATASDNSGARSYPFYCCEALRAVSYRVAYGGSGAVANGSLYKFSEAAYKITNSNFENNAKIDVIVVNHGTNDMYGEASDFETGYRAGLKAISQLYPNTPIFCMIPYAQPFTSIIPRVAAEFPHTFVVQTAGWISKPNDFTDNLHPNQTGHQKAGAYLAEEIKKTLGSDFFFES